MKEILKVLVGSRAHGLHDKDSDHDYRGVYVTPTIDILSLGYKYKGTNWIEGREDNTSYEIGHFLMLATKCNPSILEVMVAEQVTSCTPTGIKLRDLFPYIWNPGDAYNAFTGYSLNQRKKLLENKENRANKFGVAYIRTLINLISLLRTGKFGLLVPDMYRENLLAIRRGEWSPGKIIDWADCFAVIAEKEREKCQQTADLPRINSFLLDVREENL